eukprot:3833729-Amphidinium_carterae.1
MTFSVSLNRFTGTLPTGAMGAMTSVTLFDAFKNKFTGTLAGEAVREMGSVKLFQINDNRLASTLPEGLRRMTRMWLFGVGNNEFSLLVRVFTSIVDDWFPMG